MTYGQNVHRARPRFFEFPGAGGSCRSGCQDIIHQQNSLSGNKIWRFYRENTPQIFFPTGCGKACLGKGGFLPYNCFGELYSQILRCASGQNFGLIESTNFPSVMIDGGECDENVFRGKGFLHFPSGEMGKHGAQFRGDRCVASIFHQVDQFTKEPIIRANRARGVIGGRKLLALFAQVVWRVGKGHAGTEGFSTFGAPRGIGSLQRILAGVAQNSFAPVRMRFKA